MKYYLITAKIVDGEHEHRDHVILTARTQSALRKKIEKIFHKADDGIIDGHNAYFGYCDGLTSSTHEHTQEITQEETLRLEQLGVAHRHEP